MQKKVFIVSCILLLSLFNAQVGILTTTPKKTLHVNGTLQITNELNVGGTASTVGDAGTTGQVLVSQGTNKAPQWTTLDIPKPDLNAYKLVNVYETTLGKVTIMNTDEEEVLGIVNDVVINKPNSFVLIQMQGCAYTYQVDGSISYRFIASRNNYTEIASGIEIITKAPLFTGAINNNFFQFKFVNLSAGNHNFVLKGKRLNSVGNAGGMPLHFNTMTPDLRPFDGSLIIYVYEKN
ncbi:hypothetical protein [Chryseobacterium jejuense]|uniref:hypothetical protein n=1 Tax=Chryseobacterium jejuense TaxID=445960 RepID=UPI003D12BB46